MKPRPKIWMIAVFFLLFSGSGWYAINRVLPVYSLPGAEMAHAADTRYTCGMHPMIITDEPGTCPICGMDLTPLKAETGGGGGSQARGERKIKYWVAPMDPTYIRDEPGKSPMGMDLVPVYEDESATGSVITIDPVTSQNMGVRTEKVQRRDLARTVRTVGLVEYDEPRQYSVNTKISGWVERLYVDETGQFVKKGQKLLDIYSPELVTAQEEFLLALKSREALAGSPYGKIAESGRQLFDAARRRLQLWDISDRQIRQLEETRQVQKTLALHAPQAGIVTKKMVREGQFIKVGMDLMTISDISTVWVMADIYEYELPWVSKGQEAIVSLPFVGGKDRRAEITYIYPYVEPKTRTVKARLEFENPDFELKPDMYVNVRIRGQEVKNALTIPVESVIHSGEKKTVFVALGEGKFEPRHVRTGLQNQEGYIEIEQGLLEGENIVTSAQFMFDSESKLREAIQKMMAPREGEPTAEEAREEPAEEMDEELEDLFGDHSEQPQQENLDDLFQ
ncbi:MAG TPA: efflux RND transporter periplasmic adaptor subunit [Desulfuromonadales bacterium]|nr:efflux RND transporter periplasmic adaptor subunit [Desulfuromonadales bacterium]